MSTYEPKPLDTSKVSVNEEQAALIEALAANAHDVWAATRIAQGWSWGERRDDDRKLHPNLVPYDELSEDDKDVDRAMVDQAIKATLALGFTIEKRAAR